MGENNSKWSNWQTANLKNIQATPAAQFWKNKQPNQKIGQRTKQTFLQRRHTDDQQTHEKMLNNPHYERNANQNYLRYHLTRVRMASLKNLQTIISREGVEKKGTFLHCWWESKLIQLLWRTVWRCLWKMKTTIWPSNPTTGHLPWEKS